MRAGVAITLSLALQSCSSAGDVQTEFNPGDHYQSTFVGNVGSVLLVLLVLKAAFTFTISLIFAFLACPHLGIFHKFYFFLISFLVSFACFDPALPIFIKPCQQVGRRSNRNCWTP